MLKDFVAITRRVIARDGFATFLPTAYYPARRHIMVLEGIPDHIEHEAAAVPWAIAASQGDEDVLIAFRVDDSHFKVVVRSTSGIQSETFAV